MTRQPSRVIRRAGRPPADATLNPRLPRQTETFFETYLRLTGLPHLGPETAGELPFVGRRVGILNGSSWITAWSTFFGRRYLPGAHLVNAGNEAVQLSFMRAHAAGEACPPARNIARFTEYARDLVELADVDIVLVTCSTMNRSYPAITEALAPSGVPVVQIDVPMMERAVTLGGPILVVATHGPTVESTRTLLDETALQLGRSVDHSGITVEAAWDALARADVRGHNDAIAEAIRRETAGSRFRCVVLAQLSMAAILFSHPDPSAEFGVPVLTSAEYGFGRVAEILRKLPSR